MPRGRTKKKPDCESAFRPVKHRPERLRDGRTITKFSPENQRRDWLCASNYVEGEGFLTCLQARRRGLCKRELTSVSGVPPELEALRTQGNASEGVEP